jgi:hypothetical protein
MPAGTSRISVLDNKPEYSRVNHLERDETITRLAVLKAAANFPGQFSQCHDGVRFQSRR